MTYALSGPTRRTVLLSAAAAAAAPAMAASETPTADFLFVQTASGVRFDRAAGRLTLVEVSPVTLFFSDRPERIAGNMSTARFVPFWSEGPGSFRSDPPNADLSVIENGALRQTVVVLKDPELAGTDLSYTVEVLNGDLPAGASEASLFIDVIGRPLTPVSFAGADRRAFRRAVIY